MRIKKNINMEIINWSDAKFSGLISVSGQLPTYPSPNPTLTSTCCQLTVVDLGKG